MRQVIAFCGVLLWGAGVVCAAGPDTRCCEQEYPSLLAQGEGRMEVAPDKATFRFILRLEEKKLEKAFDESSKRINAASEALIRSGVKKENIQNLGYTYHPLYEGKKIFTTIDRPTSYEVVYTLKIAVLELANLGKILGALAGIPESRVEGLDFTSTKLEEFKRDALKKAGEDARAKAQKLAEGAGASVGRVLRIDSNVNGGYRPVFRAMAVNDEMMMASRSAKAVAEPQVESGMIEVTANCSVTYLLK